MGPIVLLFFLSFYYNDNFLPLINFSSRHTGGSTGLLYPGMTVFTLLPGLAKITPWLLARRDYFLSKVPELVSAGCATNVYSLNRPAVSGKPMHYSTHMKAYHGTKYINSTPSNC